MAEIHNPHDRFFKEIFSDPEFDGITREDLNQAVKPLFEQKKGEVMPTIAETLRKEGMQIGLRKGRQEGRQEGTAALTMRQLQKRFGKVEKRAQTRIKTLSVEQLEQLGEALLDFQTPQDLTKWLKAQADINS